MKMIVRYRRASGTPVQWGRLAMVATLLARGLPVLGAAIGLQLVPAQAQPAITYERLKSFGFPDQTGANPAANVIEGSDGALYGTTEGGGSAGNGTVFKLNPDGSGYTVLKSFTGPGGDGGNPRAALVQASDGALYGTTSAEYSSEGNYRAGTVFKLNPDGSGFAVLKIFTGGDGASPQAALVQASDGALYGTTAYGGGAGGGTVFKLNPDGSGHTVLRSFSSTGGDGAHPHAALVQGRDGALYGTTVAGGSAGYGTVFKLNPDGSGHTVLRSFSSTGGDGAAPWAALVRGSDGALYGTTAYGGGAGGGTVFKLNPDGSGFAVLRSFTRSGGDG